MDNTAHDHRILGDLARQYAELASLPVQEERRQLWAAHFSLKPTPRPPIIALFGMWNVWCREQFGDHQLQCRDPFLRDHERDLRLKLFHHTVGDDFILEPWIVQPPVYRTATGKYGEPWGIQYEVIRPENEGGAYKDVPPIRNWSDVASLSPPPHLIDEAELERRAARLHEAVGSILPIDVQRGSLFMGLASDISTTLGALRGMEQVMYDLYESPDELLHLIGFLSAGILANQEQAEAAGDYSLTSQFNQSVTYAQELERPRPNSGPRRRQDLWGMAAAQEFTLVSPEFHEEFLLRHQIPLLAPFGLVHYGCCENLTRKIHILRQIPNLRSIAVTPSANVAACAEQIGRDYAISWRPSPADMVCTDWNEPQLRRLLQQGLRTLAGTRMHINLKDIETLQGDSTRLARWVAIVRQEFETAWQP
ncbi:MAG: hypothetical protein K8T26_12815 [Lentisphaerae bacterium]|nr:hypothetical protein [Lentisphaerota bacterium]